MLKKRKMPLIDSSPYKSEHDKVIEYVKEQVNIDLNEYRDGDGENPYYTTFWDKKGPKTCINWCGSKGGMSEEVQSVLTDLVNKSKGKLVLEWGGAWFKYIYLSSSI